MKKTVVACACLALLLVVAAPAQAALSKAAGATGIAPVVTGPLVLLYDQTSSPSGNGAPDQDFEAAFNAYDSEAADDFVVTAPGWTIQQINTIGTTGVAGSSTVDLNFHLNSAGGGDPDLPGAVVAGCSYLGIVPTDAAGSLTIVLPTACVLAPGTYWVAINVNQNFGTNGQHFWSNRTVQAGSEGVWRNPGGGFATGCATFTPQTICGVGGGASPDFLFQVHGELGGLDADVELTKTGSAVGDQVTFTLSVTNNGPNDATGVVVTDNLPAGLTYVSDDCGGVNTPPFTWNIGNLANAATVVCNITLTADAPGEFFNSASVASTSPDPTSINNIDDVTVGVDPAGPPAIPTLSGAGLAALLALIAVAALVAMRRMRA